MDDLVIHQQTRQHIEQFVANPPQAVLISGPAGIGKASIARLMAARLVNVAPEKLVNAPYFRHVAQADKASITIEQVRELNPFLARRVPGKANRVILIESADLLSEEAQNALLKSLEEPPERTFWLLTVDNPRALLATVRSRATSLKLTRPAETDLTTYFSKLGHSTSDIQRALLMSGGLPGLMNAVLDGDHTHPLLQASAQARELLQADTFGRLTMVDTLSKDRSQAIATLDIMQAMAHIALSRGAETGNWQAVQRDAYTAVEELLGSGQPRLVLTNLMLKLAN